MGLSMHSTPNWLHTEALSLACKAMRGLSNQLPGAEASDGLAGLGMSIATSPGELAARRRSESALLGLLPEWDIDRSPPAP